MPTRARDSIVERLSDAKRTKLGKMELVLYWHLKPSIPPVVFYIYVEAHSAPAWPAYQFQHQAYI